MKAQKVCPKCKCEIGIDMSGRGRWYSYESGTCNECIIDGQRRYAIFVCIVCAFLLIVMAIYGTG